MVHPWSCDYPDPGSGYGAATDSRSVCIITDPRHRKALGGSHIRVFTHAASRMRNVTVTYWWMPDATRRVRASDANGWARSRASTSGDWFPSSSAHGAHFGEAQHPEVAQRQEFGVAGRVDVLEAPVAAADQCVSGAGREPLEVGRDRRQRVTIAHAYESYASRAARMTSSIKRR